MYSSSCADHFEQALRPRQNVRQIANLLQQLLELGDDLVLLESGEPVQAHLQNRLRLCLGQPIAARRRYPSAAISPSGRVLIAPARSSICGTAPDLQGRAINAALGLGGRR